MHPLREALLRGRNRPRNAGAGSPTTLRGDGYEFVELREYVAGDDPRRLDWAATARSGALQTRVVLEDVALTIAAISDNSLSMHVGRRRALSEGAKAALAAWYGAAQEDDRCSRLDPSGPLAPLGLRGRRSAQACLHAPPAHSDKAFDLTRAMDVARAALPFGAALLVVSDFFDLAPESGQLLREMGRRFDCTALCAADPWGGALPLRGFVRLQDAETGETRTLFVGRNERRRYREAVSRRGAALLQTLRSAGWRAEPFGEDDAVQSLRRAFGLPA